MGPSMRFVGQLCQVIIPRLFVFLFFIALMTFSILGEHKCASGCYCHHGGDIKERITHTVDCSSRKLSKVPSDIPYYVTRLILSGNDFSQMQEFNWSKWIDLRELALANTNLSGVQPAFFNGLDKLERLTLSKNNISALDKETFTSLSNLRFLEMSSNSLTSWSHYKGLEDLETLYLQRNKISHLPSGAFFGMNKLTHLNLGENLIGFIHDNAFTGLRELQNLTLSRNQLTHITEGIFSPLRELRALLLQKNKLVSIHPDAFTHLRKLQYLELNQNRLTSIHSGLLSNLAKLQVLFLDYNQLNIETNVKIFNGLTSLTKLEIGHNKLKSLHYGIFAALWNLRSLNLEYNDIFQIHKDAFTGLTKLYNLNLDMNNITLLEPFTFIHLPWLFDLSLRYNMITILQKETFTGLQNLDQLALSYNIVSSIARDTFMYLSSTLRMLDLSYNDINWIHDEAFSGLQRLSYLLLGGNQMTCSCNYTIMLRFLNIDFISADCFAIQNASGPGENDQVEEFLHTARKHKTHAFDSCGKGCTGGAYITTSTCIDCAADPTSLCSNLAAFYDRPSECVHLSLQKNKNKGNGRECKISSCSSSQSCKLKNVSDFRSPRENKVDNSLILPERPFPNHLPENGTTVNHTMNEHPNISDENVPMLFALGALAGALGVILALVLYCSRNTTSDTEEESSIQLSPSRGVVQCHFAGISQDPSLPLETLSSSVLVEQMLPALDSKRQCAPSANNSSRQMLNEDSTPTPVNSATNSTNLQKPASLPQQYSRRVAETAYQTTIW